MTPAEEIMQHAEAKWDRVLKAFAHEDPASALAGPSAEEQWRALDAAEAFEAVPSMRRALSWWMEDFDENWPAAKKRKRWIPWLARSK